MWYADCLRATCSLSAKFSKCAYNDNALIYGRRDRGTEACSWD